jgi:hypothetical protein
MNVNPAGVESALTEISKPTTGLASNRVAVLLFATVFFSSNLTISEAQLGGQMLPKYFRICLERARG